jgi:long-subunit acyl-CoA synthetase (AMP-forming)
MSDILDKLKASQAQRVHYYEGNSVCSKDYRELGRDVERVVGKMNALGLRKGDCIGILANNCYEWLVVDLAIIHIQAVCVALPVEHFATTDYRTLADKYDLRLLVTDQRGHLSAGKRWITGLKTIFTASFLPRDVPASNLGDKSDLFSLSFSSGTPRQVKCLKISRRGTNKLLEAFGRDFQFRPDDSIIAFLPLATIQQRWMLYTSIHYGFNLCLCTAVKLFDALKVMKPTIVCAAPILFETVESHYLLVNRTMRRFLAALAKAASVLPLRNRQRLLRHLYHPIYQAFGGKVRFFLVGSAPSRTSTLRFYASIGLPLYEAWGLTETGFLTWNVPGKARIGSVGMPVYENALHIMEDGEIVVRHDDLPCSGYYGVDPEEERKTFPEPGLLATGDLGYFADGFLYISGRKKDMIVTRGGVKIQPAELEQEIKRNPYVESAVVFGGDNMLCLKAVVSTRGRAPDIRKGIQASIDALNAKKPAPSRILKVVFSPEPFSRENGLLNRNLKVDRKSVFERFKAELSDQ